MRAKFTPSQDQREAVELMIALRHDQSYIAEYLSIDQKTLRANFAKELKGGGRAYGAKLVVALSRCALRGNASAAKEILRQINSDEPHAKPNRAQARRGLKVSADELAKTAHIGTSWEAILGDSPFVTPEPKTKRRRAV